MIEFDMGIIYNSKLKETRNTIEKLKGLSFNLDNIANSVNSIESGVNEKIKGIYNTDKKEKNVFFNDELKYIYDDAIKKLDKINEYLKKEYERYYKISSLTKKLNSKMENVSEENIDEIVSLSTQILHTLKTSSTIDYEAEKNIVTDVYSAIYNAIKLEVLYSNNTRLLDIVKNDDVDTQYIANLIKKDINNIKDKSDINRVLTNIENNGLDDKYLIDRNLITLISLYNSNNLKLKTRNKLISNVDEYESLSRDLAYLEIDNKEIQEKIDKANTKRNKQIKKKIKQRGILTLNALLVSIIIAGGSFGIKHIAKEKKYKTITTKYDSYTDTYEVEEEYASGKDGSIKLTEYSPWDSPGYFRDNYTRNVYSYDIGNISTDYSDISKFLNSNIKDNLRYNQTEESSTDLPEDYGYGENKYIIEEVRKVLDDYIIDDIETAWTVVFCLLYALGVIAIDIGSISNTSMEQIHTIKDKIFELESDLREYNSELDSNKEEIGFIRNKINELKNLIFDLYDSLPNVIKESNDIKEAMKKVR